jgi:hypothetical protein
MARRIKNNDPPGYAAKKETKNIDADKRSEPLPASGKRRIGHLAPAEMEDEAGG